VPKIHQKLELIFKIKLMSAQAGSKYTMPPVTYFLEEIFQENIFETSSIFDHSSFKSGYNPPLLCTNREPSILQQLCRIQLAWLHSFSNHSGEYQQQEQTQGTHNLPLSMRI
jgi:hypothetical protein